MHNISPRHTFPNFGPLDKFDDLTTFGEKTTQMNIFGESNIFE